MIFENDIKYLTEIKYTKKHNILYYVWAKIDRNEKVLSLCKGKRIWVAGDEYEEKKYMKSYHYAGDPGWPDEGVTLQTEYGYEQNLTIDSVRLHPSEL